MQPGPRAGFPLPPLRPPTPRPSTPRHAFPADPPITPALVKQHKLTDEEYAPRPSLARPRADLRRARRLQRHVERALLLQVEPRAPPPPAHQGAARHPGPRRERGGRRHRRRVRRRLQDGVAQPPELHRAAPGRGDRRRRHPPRRLHDGRAPHREPELAALRPARSPAHARAPARRRRRHRRLRQLHRRAHGGRRGPVRRALRREHPRQRLHLRRRPHRSHLLRSRERHRQQHPLHRRQDGARRHPRRHDGERRLHRTGARPAIRTTMQVGDPFMGKLLIEACLQLFSEDVLEGIQDMGAAGLTSSSVEMAGRADNGVEIDLDSVPRRAKAHDAVRDPAQRVAGAHAARRQAGQGGARPRDLRAAGTSTPRSSAR